MYLLFLHLWCYNVYMNNEKCNKINVRIIKYDSDSYVSSGDYKIAVYESLKEAGVFTHRKTTTGSQASTAAKARIIK